MSHCDVIEGPEHVPIKAWTRGVPIEDAALKQLKNVASLPFIHKHVAAMPDVHWGMGATVGSVIPTVGAIIPADVGVWPASCSSERDPSGLSPYDTMDVRKFAVSQLKPVHLEKVTVAISAGPWPRSTGSADSALPELLQRVLADQDSQDLLFAYLRISDPRLRAAARAAVRALSTRP